ncbi:MAG: MarC family protein [Rhizobacter sp.]|nr:MarC family protein [Chlorobiales bacterium]
MLKNFYSLAVPNLLGFHNFASAVFTADYFQLKFDFSGFLLTFIPIFVAMDVVGTLPLFIGLTQDIPERAKRRLTLQAVLTAFAVAIVIITGGKSIFNFLGITIADFKIAGGLILLLLSIRDLIFAGDDESKKPADPEHIGVVPLGIPLIIGPAVLTTLLILADTYGLFLTIFSLVLNLVIVFFTFYFSRYIERLIGRNGARAVAKIAALFLAAIAVMMIRIGIMDILPMMNPAR